MKKLLYLLILAPLAILAQPKLEWAHNYHPDQENELFPLSHEIVTDDTAFVYYAGNYVGGTDYDPTAGVDYHENAGSGDMFLQKINKDDGSIVWTRTWGSPGADRLEEIALDRFGNIYVTGKYELGIDLNPGQGIDFHSAKGFNDLFILKLDKDGNYLWGHSFKSGNIEYHGGIDCDQEGNVYFGAIFGADLSMDENPEIVITHKSVANTDDCFISKFSTQGQLVWIHSYSREGSQGTILREVIIDNNDELIISGVAGSHADFDFGPGEKVIPGDPVYVYLHKISKVDAALIDVQTVPWRNIFDLHFDDDNNLYMIGRTHISDTVDMDPGSGEMILDYYDGTEMLLKYNASWEYQWVTQISTVSGNFNSVEVDSLGNVYASIYITNPYSLHREQNPETLILNRKGFPTALLIKYNSDGHILWFKDYDGQGTYAWNVVLDNEEYIYVAGDYTNFIDLDLDTGKAIIQCGPSNQGQYVAKYRNCMPVYSTINVFSCSGDSLEYPSGKGYIYQGGIYKDTVQTAVGCDSVITIQANFAYYITEEHITSCEPYTLPNGVQVERDTLVQIIYDSRLGCDSLARFYVDITDRLPLKKEQVTACDSLELPNGNMVYQSQNYNYEIEGPNACPQEIELNIKIKYSSFSNQAGVFCDSYEAPDQSVITAPGKYEYFFTNASGCDSTVYLSLAQESLNLNLINHGDSLSAVQNDALYQWVDCADNSPIPSATQQGLKPVESGTYKVAISYLDCQDTSACEQITVAGVLDIETWRVEVYPNPFKGYILINRLNTTDELSYELLGLSGKILRAGPITQGESTLKTERLAQGTYFLRIINQNGDFVTKKLFKN